MFKVYLLYEYDEVVGAAKTIDGLINVVLPGYLQSHWKLIDMFGTANSIASTKHDVDYTLVVPQPEMLDIDELDPLPPPANEYWWSVIVVSQCEFVDGYTNWRGQPGMMTTSNMFIEEVNVYED